MRNLKIFEKETCWKVFWLFIVSETPNHFDIPVIREDNMFELISVMEDIELSNKQEDEPVPL